MTERIPEEYLQAATLAFCRRIAIALVGCLEGSGLSLEEVDARLRKRKGWARKFINGLLDTSVADGQYGLRDIAGFATACGMELQLRAMKIEPISEIAE